MIVAALKSRPLPVHVGLILDGNRRYAEREHVEKAEGHRAGYKRMLNALEWCLELGITHVSVYAFSVDNFNRSGEEVSALMSLAEEKLIEMLQERDVLARHGVRVRVVGRLDLLPERVQRAAARAMRATEHHTGGVLNICLCYTSRHEMAHAVGIAQKAVEDGVVPPEALDCRTLDQCLSTSPSPPLDLLVRTSGEARLSDFMLRQCATAKLVFLKVLWPDLTFHHFARAILDYQHTFWELRRVRRCVLRQQSQQALGPTSSASTTPLEDDPRAQLLQDRDRAHSASTASARRLSLELSPLGGKPLPQRKRSGSPVAPTVDSASELPSGGDSPVEPSTSPPLLLLGGACSSGLAKRIRARRVEPVKGLQLGTAPSPVYYGHGFAGSVRTGPVPSIGLSVFPSTSIYNFHTPGLGGVSGWVQELGRVWTESKI